MTNLEELQKLIEKRGVTMTYLAKGMGIARESLYNKMAGKTEFKVSEANNLAKLLNMDNFTKSAIFFGN